MPNRPDQSDDKKHPEADSFVKSLRRHYYKPLRKVKGSIKAEALKKKKQ